MTKLRSLLVNMASHMAYMQGQLEAQHQFDDPEDYYWYRESEALRAKVEAALAEPEPEGPSDEQLLQMAADAIGYESIKIGEYECEGSAIEAYGSELLSFARAVLARWGNHRGILGNSTQPPSGEVEG